MSPESTPFNSSSGAVVIGIASVLVFSGFVAVSGKPVLDHKRGLRSEARSDVDYRFVSDIENLKKS